MFAYPRFQRRATGDERQRIKIALQHQVGAEGLRRPIADRWSCRGRARRHRFAPRNPPNASGAFRKADHPGILVAAPQASDNGLDRGKTPMFEFGIGQDAGPSVEDLHGLDTGFDLPGKIIDRRFNQPVDEPLK